MGEREGIEPKIVRMGSKIAIIDDQEVLELLEYLEDCINHVDPKVAINREVYDEIIMLVALEPPSKRLAKLKELMDDMDSWKYCR